MLPIVLFSVFELVGAGEGPADLLDDSSVFMLETGEHGDPMQTAIAAGVKAAMKSVGADLHISGNNMRGIMDKIPADLNTATRDKNDAVSTKMASEPTDGDAAEAELKRDQACDKANQLRALGLATMAATFDADCRELTHAADKATPQQLSSIAYSPEPENEHEVNLMETNTETDSAREAANNALSQREENQHNSQPRASNAAFMNADAKPKPILPVINARKDTAMPHTEHDVTSADLNALRESMLGDIAKLIPRSTPPPSPPSGLSTLEAQMQQMAIQLNALKQPPAQVQQMTVPQQWPPQRFPPTPLALQSPELGSSLDSLAGASSLEQTQSAQRAQMVERDILTREAAVVAEEQKAREAQQRAEAAQEQARIAVDEAKRNEEASEQMKASAAAQVNRDTQQAQHILERARAESANEELHTHQHVEEVEKHAEEEATRLTSIAQQKVEKLEAAAIKHAQLIQAKSQQNNEAMKATTDKGLVQARKDVIDQTKKWHAKLVSLRLQVARAGKKQVAWTQQQHNVETRMSTVQASEKEISIKQAKVKKLMKQAHDDSQALEERASKDAEDAKKKASQVLAAAAEKAEQLQQQAQHKSEEILSTAEENAKKSEEQVAEETEKAKKEAKDIIRTAEDTATQKKKEMELEVEKEKAEAQRAAEHIQRTAEQEAATSAAKQTKAEEESQMKTMHQIEKEKSQEVASEMQTQQQIASERQNATMAAASIRANAEKKALLIEQQAMADASKLRRQTQKQTAVELAQTRKEITSEEEEERHRIALKQEEESTALTTARSHANELVQTAKKEAQHRIENSKKKAESIEEEAKTEAAAAMHIATVKAKEAAEKAASEAKKAAALAQAHAQDAAKLVESKAMEKARDEAKQIVEAAKLHAKSMQSSDNKNGLAEARGSDAAFNTVADGNEKELELNNSRTRETQNDAALKIEMARTKERQEREKAQETVERVKQQKVKEEMKMMKLAKSVAEEDHTAEEEKIARLKPLKVVVKRQKSKVAALQASVAAANKKLAEEQEQNRKEHEVIELLTEKAANVKKFAEATAARLEHPSGTHKQYTDKVRQELLSDVSSISHLLDREHEREAEEVKETAIFKHKQATNTKVTQISKHSKLSSKHAEEPKHTHSDSENAATQQMSRQTSNTKQVQTKKQGYYQKVIHNQNDSERFMDHDKKDISKRKESDAVVVKQREKQTHKIQRKAKSTSRETIHETAPLKVQQNAQSGAFAAKPAASDVRKSTVVELTQDTTPPANAKQNALSFPPTIGTLPRHTEVSFQNKKPTGQK
jgi:hypothetical protein